MSDTRPPTPEPLKVEEPPKEPPVSALTSKLQGLMKLQVPKPSESKPEDEDEPFKKKPIIAGLSALAAFSSNQGYTFAPIKKYDEKHVFFGVKEEVKEPPPQIQIP